MQKKPRVNKTKQELVQEVKNKANIEHQRDVARRVFPVVESLETVYDAQTAFIAVSGLVKQGLILAEAKLKVADIEIDTKFEKETDVTKAIMAILDLVKDEPAQDVDTLLEKMGNSLPQFLGLRAVKGPMSQVAMDDFIAS